MKMQLSHLADWMQELRPHANALGAAVGALAGAGLFFGFSFDVAWFWGLFFVGSGLLVRAFAWRKVMLALAYGLVVAGAVFALAGWQVVRVVPVDYGGGKKAVWMVGDIEEIRQKDDPARVVLRLKDVDAYGEGRERINEASIGVYKNQVKDLAVGDSVAVQAVLIPPEGPKYKGQRDGRLWKFFNDSRVAGFVLGSVEPTWRAPKEIGRIDGILREIDAVREAIFSRTQRMANGAVAALLVGDERGISPELREAYRKTGLSHLLAISGMQLTLVAMGVFWALRWLGACIPWVALRVDVRLWAALMALVSTLFYTLLAGASVSVVRASLMAAIVMLAVVSGRVRSALRGWCVAVVVVLMVSPVMVTRAGFLLSISAVLALLLLARSEEQCGRGPLKWLRELVLVTCMASAATAPVLVAMFGQFSMVGMLANLVAVPIMALATYTGMAALVAWPFGLEKPVLGLMTELVGIVNNIALYFSKWEWASVEVGREWWWVIALFSVVVVGSILLKRWVEAGVGLAGMVAFVVVVVVVVVMTSVKPDVMVWADGKIGLVRVENSDVYRVMWAERPKDAEQLAKFARVKLEPLDEVGQSVDERFMPVTEQEHFAWAEWSRGRWEIAPVRCGRVWERTGVECFE